MLTSSTREATPQMCSPSGRRPRLDDVRGAGQRRESLRIQAAHAAGTGRFLIFRAQSGEARAAIPYFAEATSLPSI